MDRILVVDDNPADLFLIREALASAGVMDYALEVAEDGDEALRMLNAGVAGQDRPILIVLDLNLPKRGGTEVLQAIRKNPQTADMLVVTWTSSIAPQEAERLRELGVDEHIVKPMRLEEYTQIGQTLRNLLAQRQQRAALGAE
jgi:CheY-like chemotaxis protein